MNVLRYTTNLLHQAKMYDYVVGILHTDIFWYTPYLLIHDYYCALITSKQDVTKAKRRKQASKEGKEERM